MKLKIVDEELYPASIGTADREGDFAKSAVELGLYNVLGRDLFEADHSSTDSKREVLMAALRQVVRSSTTDAAKRARRHIRDLPEEISALVGADQGVPF